MTQQEKDKEIACTVNTGMQLAGIVGNSQLKIKDIYEKVHSQFKEIDYQDVSMFLRMSSYTIFEENGEQYIKF